MESAQSAAQRLEQLFTAPALEASWFADRFLTQIPLAQIDQIVRGITNSLGAYQRVEAADGQFRLIFERGQVPTRISLNRQGQIIGLLFEAPQLSAIAPEEILAEFEALPGEKHLLVLRDGEPLLSLNPEQPLAVGSAFKLQVLQALQAQIAAGVHQWDEIMPLQAELKSLPSGFLQTWPAGSPLTLQTLAALMMSQSDNTATDHVIALVGRESIEALSPRNQPFLNTREFFTLKAPENEPLLQRYRQDTVSERRALLATLANLNLPSVDIFNNGPVALDVEWFMSATELCDAIAAVADLPLMSINPGLADAKDWQRVAFKGGSEPGVENLTTYLEAADGQHYCVTATWNNPDGIDEIQFSTLYRGILSLIQAEP
ncbi:MAG: serine hydrolase [Leptolyngbya sp. SIO4C1]|nr:serine hydrolase [Leptolyngbya sp. SIO4C1]